MNLIPVDSIYCGDCPCLIEGFTHWWCTLFEDIPGSVRKYSPRIFEPDKKAYRLNKCLKEKPKIVMGD